MTHLEIAQNYIQELLQRRADIVAVAFCGSLVRKQGNEFSDIDLVVFVTSDVDPAMTRRGTDAWREGVYIDAELAPQKEYTNLEAVLSDPMKATHTHDATILYDPTGFLTQLQQTVRHHYQEPHWLRVRAHTYLEQAYTSFRQLGEGIQRGDPLQICAGLGWITFTGASVPLLAAGITPSSMRNFSQLETVSPEIRAHLVDLEGPEQLTLAHMQALDALVWQVLPFADASGASSQSLLPKSLGG